MEMDDKPAKSLWLRIKGQTKRGKTVVGDHLIRNRKPLVLTGNLNKRDICWKDNTAGKKTR